MNLLKKINRTSEICEEDESGVMGVRPLSKKVMENEQCISN